MTGQKENRVDTENIRIWHRDTGLYGMNGWYWADGPNPKMLYGTSAEALAAAHAAIAAATEPAP